jgi:hypothetical protein
MEPIEFSRRFQVWAYTVGHRQLLLRSTKAGKHGTRIDVLFKNVTRIDLPTQLESLRVNEAGAQVRAAVLQALRADGTPTKVEDQQVFEVSGSGVTGIVVAGYVGFVEDEGEYDDPSVLLSA